MYEIIQRSSVESRDRLITNKSSCILHSVAIVEVPSLQMNTLFLIYLHSMLQTKLTFFCTFFYSR